MSPQLPSTLATVIIHPDRSLYRMGGNEWPRSLFFGNRIQNRFTDPSQENYRVMYAGEDAGVSFVETLANGRTKSYYKTNDKKQPVDKDGHPVECDVDAMQVKKTDLFLIIARKSLKFADLSAMPGSPRTGKSGRDECQQWSRLIWEHPDRVDGIQYKSWQDRDKSCYAIFDRATNIQSISLGSLWEDNNKELLDSITMQYDIQMLNTLVEPSRYQSTLVSVETQI
jgi:RES domain